MEDEFTPQTVDVRVVDGAISTRRQTADYSGYQTYVFAGTEQPIRILGQDENRARAYIMVSGTGPVWIGTESQCQQIAVGANQTAGRVAAGILVSGNTLKIEHKQELWLVPDGTHSATVMVANERWGN
jgi:hypothetical protein